jgi:hypothetical protein
MHLPSALSGYGLYASCLQRIILFNDDNEIPTHDVLTAFAQ